ncbi:helix-turn-helix transcriptional regulator [Anaerocolumna sp. AGMB13020]|uniref:helix-turn-helix domain-containing protein n=1 Tax=Anaerocolumna sp. AGMB13020 TaxID=3081750 RepID=UPI0029546034|nr:helix-turn-helix transcriptional regulator [Anaerocolumna sp. AGMB13020]WOO37565.1 helix-turn-helix transcriptional regulator [Anaerocolumna sp. AGMB13020]
MTNDMTFGKCLKSLLAVLDISMNRLAKALNVDSSLVNRWVHEVRVPSYNTLYIENIAEYLSRYTMNTVQLERIEELYQQFSFGLVPDISTKEKIKKMLLESQGVSLEKKKNNSKSDKTQKEEPPLSLSSSTIKDPTLSFSPEDRIIIGTENILITISTLFEKASRSKKASGKRIIYITLLNNLFSSRDTPYNDILLEFRENLKKAALSGWQIVISLKLSLNLKQNTDFILFLFPVIATGRVRLLYSPVNLISLERDMCVVTGIAALSSFPTQTDSLVETCFYLVNKSAIEIYSDYCHHLAENRMEELFTYYNASQTPQFMKQLYAVNKYCTLLLNYNYGLSLFLPLPILKKILTRNNVTPTSRQQVIELFTNNLKERKQLNKTISYRNIFDAELLLHIISTRTLCIYTENGILKAELDKQDILQFLENFIEFLRKSESYEIAVLYDKPLTVNEKPLYFSLKGNETLCFEMPGSKDSIKGIVTEPLMIKSVEMYFQNLWSEISPLNKDKDTIIAWLHSHMKQLLL